MKKIAILIEKLAKLNAIADQAEERYADNPENIELENEFDRAYKAESDCRRELTEAITKHTGIDSKTAYVMTFKSFDKLQSLANRIAH